MEIASGLLLLTFAALSFEPALTHPGYYYTLLFSPYYAMGAIAMVLLTIFIASLFRRIRWSLLFLLIGIIITSASGYYTSSIFLSGPCGDGTIFRSGFPLPWSEKFSPDYFDRCYVLHYGLEPTPVIHQLNFLLDIAFYTALELGALQVYSGARREISIRLVLFRKR